MKKLLFLLLLSTNSMANICVSYDVLSQVQKNVLYDAYHSGEEFNFGYTLSAIAWRESHAGLIRVNYKDPSYGIFHNHLPTVAKRLDIKGTYLMNILAQRLIDDVSFSTDQALFELKHWYKYYKGDWMKTFAGYNKGRNWERGMQYANDIKYKIKVLQTCLGVS